MKIFLNIVKHRFFALVGWLICSFLFIILGLICGAGIGYLSEAMGWVKYPDVMFSGLAFLVFPFVGGIISLIAMHIVRVLCWVKLHRRYMEVHEAWTRKHTIGIALIDEIVWLIAFTVICLLLTIVM